MKLRLADIAQHAEVSEATVSRVLNGKPGVAALTRQAVLTSHDVLGYDRPSRLRRKSAGLVGLVLPELTNPLVPAFAQVIEPALARQGFTPVLCTQTPGGVHEDDYVTMLLDRGVAGIIYVSGLHADSTSDPQRYVALLDRGLPIVLIIGFRNAMVTLLGRADVEDLIERTMFTVEGGAAAAERLIDKGVTAIVCGSDLMALGAVRAARLRGLQVPRDLSVVGYDASPLIAFTDPPLTTVRQSVRAMSEAAVRALLDQIAGDPVPRAEYIFRPELVVRGSTGAAPRARG